MKTGDKITDQVGDQDSIPCETIEEAGKRFLILSEVSNMHLVTPECVIISKYVALYPCLVLIWIVLLSNIILDRKTSYKG